MEYLNPRALAAFIGICPFPHESGSSVYRHPRADGAGSSRLRKQLYLAAMRLRRNHPEFTAYFERKAQAGKTPKLILNNIANRLLRVICGVIKSGKPYLAHYRSLPPNT